MVLFVIGRATPIRYVTSLMRLRYADIVDRLSIIAGKSVTWRRMLLGGIRQAAGRRHMGAGGYTLPVIRSRWHILVELRLIAERRYAPVANTTQKLLAWR